MSRVIRWCMAGIMIAAFAGCAATDKGSAKNEACCGAAAKCSHQEAGAPKNAGGGSSCPKAAGGSSGCQKAAGEGSGCPMSAEKK